MAAGHQLPIDAKLEERIAEVANAAGMTPGQVLRQAIEDYAAAHALTAANPEIGSQFDAFQEAGLIGCLKDAPPDLSTAEEYLEGFGCE